ncbi:MAG: 1,6-anhydro-N-acetylmuramyl-L-alanine amidase AmpD [Gammaproteobacteria bacterium]|nr:1,6-anhydro-N-acetylmuramyl-L-alanine amidase AmpD [Gammaproteobacteria bacterium]
MHPPQIINGWLQPTATIRHIPSPNFNQRSQVDIDLLVIHHISLPPHQFGGDDIIDFFTNTLDISRDDFYPSIVDLRVSAHALIKRNGEIIQFVNFNDRAWHAGESSYRGREACNDFSIGVELEGDEITPYRYAQYKSLIAITKSLIQTYPAINGNITGHEDIAPGRKNDPGPFFDWNRYLTGLSS